MTVRMSPPARKLWAIVGVWSATAAGVLSGSADTLRGAGWPRAGSHPRHRAATTPESADSGAPPTLTQLSTDAVSADTGGPVTLTLPDLPDGNATCQLAVAWDGWILDDPDATGGAGSRIDQPFPAIRHRLDHVICDLPPALSTFEGPVTLSVSVEGSKRPASTPVTIWYATPLAISIGESPYFAGASAGELLVRTNVSAHDSPSTLRITASYADRLILNTTVAPKGSAALPLSFKGLAEDFDDDIEVVLELPDGGQRVTRRVRLVRVAERRRGRSAVDHKHRALLVDGRPFLPISWFSTYLSFGTEAAVASLVDMARRGINSVMFYDLIAASPGRESTSFLRRGAAVADSQPKADVPDPADILDAAAALGIKVHVYLISTTKPLAQGNTSDFEPLTRIIKKFRRHPAVLSWYVADDFSGPHLPKVYRHIKSLDPHHLVSMAIAGSGDARAERYRTGADIIMVETYPSDAGMAYSTMNVVTRWPLEFMPAIVCGRAWSVFEDDAMITPQLFRAQLYQALIAGSTGEMWFAYRNADGWNEPGVPLLEAGAAAARELLDLAPALLNADAYGQGGGMEAVRVASWDSAGKALPDAVRARAFRETGGCVTLLVANGLNEPVKTSVHFGYGTLGIYDGSTSKTEALVPFEIGPEMRRVPVKSGQLTELLPSWGVQVFRLNGTSDCASPAAGPGQRPTPPNLIWNPSFEQFGAYVAAPLHWECAMAPWSSGACFADTVASVDGRHSGRFVTGLDVKAFQLRPKLSPLCANGTYSASVWAMSDGEMSLVAGFAGHAGGSFSEVARLELSGEWQELRYDLDLETGAQLVFKASNPGVMWLDKAVLRPKDGAACD